MGCASQLHSPKGLAQRNVNARQQRLLSGSAMHNHARSLGRGKDDHIGNLHMRGSRDDKEDGFGDVFTG